MAGEGILEGVRIFIQIRENPFKKKATQSSSQSLRRSCGKLAQSFGATLALSDSAADMIIASYPSSSFVDNMTSNGKVVVAPCYLWACKEAGERLDTAEFAVEGNTPRKKAREEAEAAKKVAKQKQNAEKKANKKKNGSVNPSTQEAADDEGGAEAVPPVRDVRTVPFLLDDEDNVEETTAAAGRGRGSRAPYQSDCMKFLDDEHEHTNPLPISDGGAQQQQPSSGDALTVPASPIAPDEGSGSGSGGAALTDDALRHAVLRSVASASNADAKNNTSGSPRNSAGGRKRARQDPFLNDGLDCNGHSSTATPSSTPATMVDVTQRLAVAGSGGGPASTPPQQRLPASLAEGDGKGKTNAALPRSAGKSRAAAASKKSETTTPKAKKKVSIMDKKQALPQLHATSSSSSGGQTVESQLLPSLHFTDKANLRVDTTAPPQQYYVALLLSSSTLVSFLSDVVEQIGGHVISAANVYGRRRKPSHVVVDADDELTPEILLAKALGVHVVLPQWLMDAVSIGGFPQVLPEVHVHPQYGQEPQQQKQQQQHQNQQQDDLPHPPRGSTGGGGGKGMMAFLSKGVADEQLPVGLQWERPHFRALLHDMMFYLHINPDDLAAKKSHSRKKKGSETKSSSSSLADAMEALEQVTELVRVLGGTVTRNRNSTHLDLVVDLSGFYHDTSGPAHTTPVNDEHNHHTTTTVCESLSGLYHDAVLRIASASQVAGAMLPSYTLEEGSEDNDHGDEKPQTVSVGWLVYSILHREKADVNAFLVADKENLTHPSKTTKPTRPSKEKKTHDDTASNMTMIKPDIIGVTSSSSAAVACTPTTQDAFLASAAVSPLAKTRQGPTGARKSAQDQLDTQQIHDAMRSKRAAKVASSQQEGRLQDADVLSSSSSSASYPSSPSVSAMEAAQAEFLKAIPHMGASSVASETDSDGGGGADDVVYSD